MRRSLRILAALLTVLPVGLSSAAVTAAAVTPFDEPAVSRSAPLQAAVRSMIRDTDGSVHVLAGLPDAGFLTGMAAQEKTEGYEVLYGERAVMAAAPVEGASVHPQNSYFSVSFPLPRTNKKAFITGLTAASVTRIQEQLIGSYETGEDFSLEDIDLIDAEKTGLEDNDDLLCWAAAVSNMLQYTGWAAKAELTSEDDVFDLFAGYYNTAGAEMIGLDWFFNGTLAPAMSLLKDDPSNGRLPDFAAETLYEVFPLHTASPVSTLRQVFDKLEHGYGVGMDIELTGWFESEHAVTLWGYVTNEDFDENDQRHYEALIISDSDSDEEEAPDRRSAVNRLRVAMIEPYEDESYHSWKLTGYGDYVIAQFTALRPYDESVLPETDPSATKNRRNSLDLTVKDMILFSDGTPIEYASAEQINTIYPKKTNFYTNEPVCVNPFIRNLGTESALSGLQYRVRLLTEDGSLLSEQVQDVSIAPDRMKELGAGYLCDGLSFDPLPVGSYRIELELNPDRTVKEAYYVNNTYSAGFTVTEPDFDPGRLFVRADIPDLSPEEYYEMVDITYGDFSQIPHEREIALISYFDQGHWGNWEEMITYEEDAEGLPTYVYMGSEGHQVRFGVLLINGSEYTLIPSEVYKLSIPALDVTSSDETTAVFSKLPAGAASLNPGEQLAFTVLNHSDEGFKTVEGSYSLDFITPDGSSCSTEEIPFTMTDKETEKTILIDHWELDTFLQGRVDVSVTVRTRIDGYSIRVASLPLGTLPFAETGSAVVTTGKDVVDNEDGLTSLREAAAFCREHPEEIVTFDENMRDDTILLASPLEVDFPLTINGLFSDTENDTEVYMGIHLTGYDSISDHYLTDNLFTVMPEGKLTLNGLILTDVDNDQGTLIRNQGGTLEISNCRMNGYSEAERGGAVFTDGGSVTIRSCVFYSTSAKNGAVLYMTGNARVSMLNSLALYGGADHSMIENQSGTLTMVYCTIAGISRGDADIPLYYVCSEGQTDLIACHFTQYTDTYPVTAFSGKVNAYACRIEHADESVYAQNGNTPAEEAVLYQLDEFSFIDTRLVYTDNYQYMNFIFLTLAQKESDKTSVAAVDGKLLYTVNGEDYLPTGADADFDPSLYREDILYRTRDNYPGGGFERGTFTEMPPVPEITSQPEPIPEPTPGPFPEPSPEPIKKPTINPPPPVPEVTPIMDPLPEDEFPVVPEPVTVPPATGSGELTALWMLLSLSAAAVVLGVLRKSKKN